LIDRFKSYDEKRKRDLTELFDKVKTYKQQERAAIQRIKPSVINLNSYLEDFDDEVKFL
jgi:hypothetical protein